MFCPRCGAQALPDAAFCVRCGAALARPATTPVPEPAPAGATPPTVTAPGSAPAPQWGGPPPPAVPVLGTPSWPATEAAPSAPYAGFWRRWAAAFLDSILLYIVSIPVWMVVNLPLMSRFEGDPGHAFDTLMSSIGALSAGLFFRTMIDWFYSAFMESSARQATVGKLALGIRVTDLEGRRISFARATGRYFGKWISGLTLMIGYVVQVFTRRRQALHDLVAGTLVVRNDA